MTNKNIDFDSQIDKFQFAKATAQQAIEDGDQNGLWNWKVSRVMQLTSGQGIRCIAYSRLQFADWAKYAPQNEKADAYERPE